MVRASSELAMRGSGLSNYLSKRTRSTTTITVPREIGINITDLVDIVVAGALRLV